jgi:sugar lactone lactonase YvrE
MKKYSVLLAVMLLLNPGVTHADEDEKGFLEGIKHHVTLSSMVTPNGDQNPYALVVAPVSAGTIRQNDVLIDNFNDISNLQGLGTTIVDYNPETKATTLFAQLDRHLPACPGGVGLSTAMAMLKSGYVIVGSTPSNDGTTHTKGNGCLMVLDANGKLVKTFADANINGPWGNMAVMDYGTSATLFISMAGFGVTDPGVIDEKTGKPVIVNKATVLRLELSIPPGQPPSIKTETVVASGFAQRADKDVFMIGPTGLALGKDNTLYVSDALTNRIAAIPDATTRKDSAGQGREVTKDGLLQRPLAMCWTPNDHLLITNGLNGQVVEVDPANGKQLYAQWVDANKAQTPPGNGDLFGLAMTPDGSGFYYVEDEVNALVLAR